MANELREPVEFDGAARYLREKVIMPTGMSSAEIALSAPARVRMQAFFSAGVTKARILERFREECAAIAGGEKGYVQGVSDLQDFLERQGMGVPTPGDPEDSNLKTLPSTSRLSLILRQNVAMAHAVGQREVSEHPAVMLGFPSYRYDATNDSLTRDSHAQYDGLILPKQHPFWDTHYPPWEFNCRCIALDEEGAPNAKGHGFVTGKDGSTTGVLHYKNRRMQLTPNPSRFVFRSAPRSIFATRPDAAGIKDPALRATFEAAWKAREAELGAANRAPPLPYQFQRYDGLLPDNMAATLAKAVKDAGEDFAARFGPLEDLNAALKALGEKPTGAHYDTQERRVYLSTDAASHNGSHTTYAHEVGHMLDFLAGDRAKAVAAAALDATSIRQNGLAGIPFAEIPKPASTRNERWKAISRLMKRGITKDAAEMLFDSVGDVTGGERGFGHSKEYYQQNNSVETVANMAAALALGYVEAGIDFPATRVYVESLVTP